MNPIVLFPTCGHQSLAIGSKCNRPDNGPVAVRRGEFLACLRIPDAHRLVFTGSSDPFSVRTEGNRHHGENEAVATGDHLTVRGIPNLDLTVEGSGGNALAIRAEGNGMYRGSMSRERQQLATRLAIPDLRGMIPACRGQ